MIGVSVLAIIGKVAGCGLGARAGGFTWRESLQLGVGMSSRGEVGLIVASVGLKNNLINNEIFSAVIGMVLVTTLITPPLLRALFKKPVGVVQSST
jgi:Kef-type K+ transport system membrane component KefB